jgi:SAM-dependent methyltransferase
MEHQNKILITLTELGISSEETVKAYYPRVRDREDVRVLKCEKSGVIILSRSDHMDIKHYIEKEEFRYVGTQDRRTALINGLEDAQRRYSQFKRVISNKKWLDVGAGPGNILELLSPIAMYTAAVEPQAAARKTLMDLGYNVYSDVIDAEDNLFDVVTLFHVVEHLIDPIGTLKSIHDKMMTGGKIIIEIPHAEDVLLSFFDNDPFKSFTFWSEHLILHTRESIEMFLKKAGYKNIVISNYQRYPLANHLYWLARGKAGGHINWPFLRTEALDRAYGEMLGQINKTDTLIIIAEK